MRLGIAADARALAGIVELPPGSPEMEPCPVVFTGPGQPCGQCAGVVSFRETKIIVHPPAKNAGRGHNTMTVPRIGQADAPIEMEEVGRQTALHEGGETAGRELVQRVHRLEMPRPELAGRRGIGQVDIVRRGRVSGEVELGDKFEIAMPGLDAHAGGPELAGVRRRTCRRARPVDIGQVEHDAAAQLDRCCAILALPARHGEAVSRGRYKG